MTFYIIIILCANILIVLGNMLFIPFSAKNLLFVSLNSIVGTLGIIAADGIGSLIVRRLLPKSWFAPGKRFFTVSKKEHNFYKKIKIKTWKDKVPELGGFTGFSKSEVKSTSDIAYLSRFIMEINYGVICHLQNAIFGFVIFLIPYFHPLGIVFPQKVSIWLPIFCVNFVLSILPVFVLRYTGYTLTRLYNKQKAKEKV